jgi:hypothetical protein
MHFKQLISVFVMVLLAGLLSACASFTPVYGDRTPSGISAARFNFAPPDSRLEQLVLNRLKIAFPGPANDADPVLDVALSVRSLSSGLSTSFDAATPARIRVDATVRVIRGDDVLFEVTRSSDTAYQGGKLTPTAIAASAGAQETAALSVAESLRVALLAGYRPTTLPLGQQVQEDAQVLVRP